MLCKKITTVYCEIDQRDLITVRTKRRVFSVKAGSEFTRHRGLILSVVRIYTVERGYHNIDLYNTSPVESDIL
jgi:hypothetical protein